MNGRTTGRCLIAFLGMLLGLALWSGVGLAQEEVIKVGMTNSFSGALATSATQVWPGPFGGGPQAVSSTGQQAGFA